MLFSLKEILSYPLRSTEGSFGRVKTFIVDTSEWQVRYLVAEVGSRDVLLSVQVCGAPDMEAQVLPVQVDKDRIINSPEIDLNVPLSRSIERQLYDYYEWPYYWEPSDVPNTLPGDLTSIPLIEMELDREQREMIPETGADNPENPHGGYPLHRADDLFGYTIHATNDGQNAGKLTDLITQDQDWSLLYLVVDTGNLFPGKIVLLAPSWVQKIDMADSRIDVDLAAQTIQDSPEIRSTLDLTPEFQTRLKDYFKRK